MQYDTHVYLGPTLNIDTAKQHLWSAHYHPPIQCGDLIRLLRLKPKRVLIIDGLYESVPAVWHKEIMVLLAQKIPVYGAASMGALRAAELHHYGMKGIGKVFEEFAQGNLLDDDEVAVLHQGKEEAYLPINDAMVNIRATCELAYLENKLTYNDKERLIDYCKKQFYPYRSLKDAIKQFHFSNEFKEWLHQNGVIDLKKKDAIIALKQVQSFINNNLEEEPALSFPATKFITSLIDEAEGTPFSFQESWLPPIENKLSQLSKNNPNELSLINKLANLIKYTINNIIDTPLPDIEHSLKSIQQEQLYLPQHELRVLQQSPVLMKLYPWILHHICLHQLTDQTIKAYSRCLPVYFNIQVENNSQTHNVLELIVLLVLLNYLQLGDKRLKIKHNIVTHHLQESGFWFRYHQQKLQETINLHTAIDFIAIYMQVIYIYQGFRDVSLGHATLSNYFDWIYDAFVIYEGVQDSTHEN